MKNFRILILVAAFIGLSACQKSAPDLPQLTLPGAPVTNEIAQDSIEYINFSASKFDALQGNARFVVFFYADWCPTCRKWEKNLLSMTTLPENTLVLKADYDNETLTNDFQVKQQSTALFFDENGVRVLEIVDPSLEQLAAFFAAAPAVMDLAPPAALPEVVEPAEEDVTEEEVSAQE